MTLRQFISSFSPRRGVAPWTLVAVGNPGLFNLETRRALGRQMIIRWGLCNANDPGSRTILRTGERYQVSRDLHVFLPSVPNQRLGEACCELLDHGADLRRMILIASDGRLRRSGEMDHPGVQQVGRTFRTSQIARLVFGIGPLVEPQDSYRAERWPDEQWERIDRLDAVFERFVALLIRTQKLSDLAAVVNHADFWAEPRVGVSDPGGRPPGFQGTKG